MSAAALTPSPRAPLEGPRLRLTRWREAHLASFAALNADPEVTRLLLRPLSRGESDQLVARYEAHHEAHGFGVWAVELRGGAEVGRLIGCVGLSRVGFVAPFNPSLERPAVELSWRLARDVWGFGYATEAARLAVDFAAQPLCLRELVAFTVPHNLRSRAVMERLGMALEGGFEHPRLPVGHSLRWHVLYRLMLG